MERHDSGDLTPQEKSIFKKLRQKKMPDPIVEERIVNSLKEKSLLEQRKVHLGLSFSIKIAVAVLIAAFIFSFGFMAGGHRSGNQVVEPSGSQFALLIFNDNVVQENELALAMEYGQWMQNIISSGTAASGEKLHDYGKILRLVDNELEISDVLTDQNYGQLGGFFLIEAENYNEAVQIAAKCPHLKYQGSIEVREIYKL